MGILEATPDGQRSRVSARTVIGGLILVLAAMMSACGEQNSEPSGGDLSASQDLSDSAGEAEDSGEGPGEGDGPNPPPQRDPPPAAKGSPIKIPVFTEQDALFNENQKSRIEDIFGQACSDVGNDPNCVTLVYTITEPDEGKCRFGGFAPPINTTVKAGTSVTVKLRGSEPCPAPDEDSDGTTGGSGTDGSGTDDSGTDDSGPSPGDDDLAPDDLEAPDSE